ncbi:MAG: hypothetical protein JWN86_1050 [Planctomycetota bacterium]|nr:hypothetical protein [Planctomycetota bacterium]
MLTLDREHLAASHRAAVELDEDLRDWDRELAACSASAGSVADLVRMLREHGGYWDRVQTGRLKSVKRAMARLMQPFFKPQIRYNLMLAEHLGRIEVALGELREQIEELRECAGK